MMGLESTMICLDNSDFMRNGDFLPTRLQAQQEAVNLLAIAKLRQNPENNIGLLTMANVEVLSTLTTDCGKIMTKLHQIQPNGNVNFTAAIRIAHLALKHRQGKNHKMKILVFIGSPIEDDEKELVKLAKKLKKEKVSTDVINFGEEAINTDKLTAFVNTINGKEGTSSHLVTVPPGPLLSDALLTSPVLMGEDGSGSVPGIASGNFEFGVDPNEDPELALALRVSMEEERARHEKPAPVTETPDTDSEMRSTADPSSEEALLEQAIAMSMRTDSTADDTPSVPDFNSMTEQEQIEFAMRMSLTESGMDTTETTPSPMDVDDDSKKDSTPGTESKTPKSDEDDDELEAVNDPAFLRSVLENLPGVDPQNEDIQRAIGSLINAEAATPNKKEKSEKPDEQ